MIAVFVCFRYESEFNEAYVRQIADGARAKFEGMLGSVQRHSRLIQSTRRRLISMFGILRRQRRHFFRRN